MRKKLIPGLPSAARPAPMWAYTKETRRSARTIRRYVAEPREQWEARSTERAAPWEDAGVARSTWYRRKRQAEERKKERDASTQSRKGSSHE